MKSLLGKVFAASLSIALLASGCGGVGSEEGVASRDFSLGSLLPPDRHSLPANTEVIVRLQSAIVSSTASVGQPVTGMVEHDVTMDGIVLIPQGSHVSGTVTAVKPAKKFGGQAMVAIGFDSVRLPSGESVPVEGGVAAYADKETAKDTGAIIGGTVGGAILGRIIGKDTKGTVTGAVIGGGIGTAVASRKGDEAYLPAGSSLTIRTTQVEELPEA